MDRVASKMIALGLRVAGEGYAEVLDAAFGDGHALLTVLARNEPVTSDEPETFTVASYSIDEPELRPEVYFGWIPTLERARVVYEEVLRTS